MLDMQKTYNRVIWILDKILQKFRFGDTWSEWIQMCVTTTSFLVLISGEPISFFKAKHGLIQGYPISPFLFIIMAKDLGKIAKKYRKLGQIEGVKPTRKFSLVLHHQFVDDTILISKISIWEAQ